MHRRWWLEEEGKLKYDILAWRESLHKGKGTVRTKNICTNNDGYINISVLSIYRAVVGWSTSRKIALPLWKSWAIATMLFETTLYRTTSYCSVFSIVIIFTSQSSINLRNIYLVFPWLWNIPLHEIFSNIAQSHSSDFAINCFANCCFRVGSVNIWIVNQECIVRCIVRGKKHSRRT